MALLSSDQLQQIHLAFLEVLEKTGVDVGLPEAVDLLGEAGADVRDPTMWSRNWRACYHGRSET